MFRNITLAATLFLLAHVSRADEPMDHINSYLDAFNSNTGIEAIAAHWHEQISTLSAQGVMFFNSNAEFAEWMKNFHQKLVSKGWVGSELLASEVCELTDNTAIVSIKFARNFKDGKRIEGASFYTLVKTTGWKIVGASINNPGVLVGCSDAT